MMTILETHLEASLVSIEGKWRHQIVQTAVIGDLFDVVS